MIFSNKCAGKCELKMRSLNIPKKVCGYISFFFFKAFCFKITRFNRCIHHITVYSVSFLTKSTIPYNFVNTISLSVFVFEIGMLTLLFFASCHSTWFHSTAHDYFPIPRPSCRSEIIGEITNIIENTIFIINILFIFLIYLFIFNRNIITL